MRLYSCTSLSLYWILLQLLLLQGVQGADYRKTCQPTKDGKMECVTTCSKPGAGEVLPVLSQECIQAKCGPPVIENGHPTISVTDACVQKCGIKTPLVLFTKGYEYKSFDDCMVRCAQNAAFGPRERDICIRA